MDIKSYIASGILEDYALGVAGENERREVECLMGIYPEIRDALALLEEDLEKFARSYSIKPPEELRGLILSAVSSAERETGPLTRGAVERDIESATVKMSPPPESKRSSRPIIGWLAAAACIAFVFAIWQYTENREKSEELAEMHDLMDARAEQMENMSVQVAELHHTLESMYAPEKKKVILEPVQPGNNARLALLWDTESGNVSIDISALPELPDDLQYQLWVLNDGQPSDMGVLPKDVSGVVAANVKTREGDAFAITIEPLGGKPTPNLDRLVAMGKTGVS